MSLQIIKSVDGKDEYVLLPMKVFNELRDDILKKAQKYFDQADYAIFEPEDYVDNPVVLARIKAGLTQAQLARKMDVTQAYISKIESQEYVTAKLLHKVKMALKL